jgi:hypothetical protein
MVSCFEDEDGYLKGYIEVGRVLEANGMCSGVEWMDVL